MITGLVCMLVITASIVYGVYILAGKHQTEAEQLEKQRKEREAVIAYFKKSDEIRHQGAIAYENQSAEEMATIKEELIQLSIPFPVKSYHQRLIQLFSEHEELFRKMNDPFEREQYNQKLDQMKEKQDQAIADDLRQNGGKYGELAAELYGPGGKYDELSKELYGDDSIDYFQFYILGQIKRLNEEEKQLTSLRKSIKEKYQVP